MAKGWWQLHCLRPDGGWGSLRPGPRRRHAGRPRLVSGRSRRLAALTAPAICAALLAACGGSSGDAAAPSSPSPASPAVPAPVATYSTGQTLPEAAVSVLRRYFAAVTRGDDEAAVAMLTPDSQLRDNPTMSILAVRDLRIYRRHLASPPAGASATAMVDAFVRAAANTAWGPPARHTFFITLTEAPAGTWLIQGFATGP